MGKKIIIGIINPILNKVRRIILYRHYTKYIKSLRSTCPEIKKLTKEQKQRIQDFYIKYYGKRLPDYLWHEYYYSRNGIFSEKYVPNYIWNEINARMLNKNIAKAFDDKNLYYTLFPDICKPDAYIKCINGYYYDNESTMRESSITKEKAENKCYNIGEAIIKPTFCSCNGKGVKYIDICNGIDKKSGLSIKELMNNYGNNFIIQKVIKQHPELAKLCPTSVNTIRIVTYRRDMEIVVIYAVMRIGKLGSEIDNTSAGGMTCNIDELGRLSKYAICSKPAGLFESNEFGIKFENYQVPYYKEVVEKAKEMHYRLPYFYMVGWDFTIDDNNQVVFVEMNAPFSLHQPAAGPGFGKYTEEIFMKCFGKESITN